MVEQIKPNHLLAALQTCSVSQYRLAQGIDIDAVTINKLCKTERRPNVDTALNIVKWLNTKAPHGMQFTVESIWGESVTEGIDDAKA